MRRKQLKKEGEYQAIMEEVHTDPSKIHTALKSISGLYKCRSWAVFYKAAIL